MNIHIQWVVVRRSRKRRRRGRRSSIYFTVGTWRLGKHRSTSSLCRGFYHRFMLITQFHRPRLLLPHSPSLLPLGSILCGSFGYPKDRFNGIDCWSSDSLKDHLGNHLLHGLLPPLALQSLGDGCPEGGGFNGGEVDPFHGSRNSIYFPINSSLHPPTIYPGSIPEAQKRKHRLGEEPDFF